ncbi:MAG TPA: GAF domain-containing sensor histidine kinase [Armatimonadota bacterium]|nr:GAF domain-containing sensor histidine kinase [Armatimonadota bacterium]
MTVTPTATLERMEPGHPSQRQAAERLACLLEVAQVINSSLELDAVLGQILSQATRILGAQSGSIMLLEEHTRLLRVHAAHGPRRESVLGRCQVLGQGVAGWVAQHGEPLRLHGSVSDGRFERVCERPDVRDALCVPLRAEERVLGVISLSNRLGDEPFSEEDLELLLALSNQAALAIRNARSFAEMRRQRQTVERLLDEVTRAQEEERARIALLLHDGPAQTMFAALRNLEAARAVVAREAAASAGVLEELERTIRAAIHETRSVMIDLRPLCLDEMGLFSALKQYGEQFQQRTGIRVVVRRRGREVRLPVVVESNLYRIAQEALTNVWKHAGVREARVVLEADGQQCSLEISDDGAGFDPEAVAERADQHLGLRSLRDRSDLVGGYLKIGGGPGQGTSVRVSVPLAG